MSRSDEKRGRMGLGVQRENQFQRVKREGLLGRERGGGRIPDPLCCRGLSLLPWTPLGKMGRSQGNPMEQLGVCSFVPPHAAPEAPCPRWSAAWTPRGPAPWNWERGCCGAGGRGWGAGRSAAFVHSCAPGPGWQPLSASSLSEGEKEGTKERVAQQPLLCRVDLAT